jgi:glucodextranase-like protein/zinc ribbon protein
MADADPGYCPRCGTERVPEMRFCGRCGLDLSGEAPAVTPAAPAPTAAPVRREAPRPRDLIPLPVLALAAVAAVGILLYLGFFAGRDSGEPGVVATAGAPGVATAGPSSSAAATPLLVGLTIVSPADGAVVATKKITVIGTAPPGLRVVQDISFGFDRNANVDGTGHWAMELELAEGDNQMTFRIGDDKSTARTIHVVYQPPAPAS